MRLKSGSSARWTTATRHDQNTSRPAISAGQYLPQNRNSPPRPVWPCVWHPSQDTHTPYVHWKIRVPLGAPRHISSCCSMPLEPKETGHCAGFFVGGVWSIYSINTLKRGLPANHWQQPDSVLIAYWGAKPVNYHLSMSSPSWLSRTRTATQRSIAPPHHLIRIFLPLLNLYCKHPPPDNKATPAAENW